jgi:hypothetical protein
MQSDTIADLHEQLEHERAEVKRHKEEARKNEYKVSTLSACFSSLVWSRVN